MLLRQLCPRCVSLFKEDDFGGTSRIDNTTHICSPCETDEAMEDFFGKVTDITQWPVNRPWSHETNEEDGA